MKPNYCIKFNDTPVIVADRLIKLASAWESIRENPAGLFADGKWTLCSLDTALESVTLKPKKNV